MAEGCFTNKEVYRLKKIVRNLEKIKIMFNSLVLISTSSLFLAVPFPRCHV